MAELEAPGKPALTPTGDGYILEWPAGIRAEVERITEHRDELTAEVTINSKRLPSPGLLHSARLNLVSSQARNTLAKALSVREPDLDWGGVVEALCFLVREHYRAGDPAIAIQSYVPSPAAPWVVEPFVERGGCTVIFADGGTGKSLLAMGISCTLAGTHDVLGRRHGTPQPVLYLDWETDADTFYHRIQAIAKGHGTTVPTIYYRRQVASLAEAAPTLRKEVIKLGIGMVVVDSLGPARGGEPESAEATIKLFNAARSLGVPWLALDHVTKSQGNDSTRPFGSTYTHNLARLTWGLDKAQEDSADATVVSWSNHKRNNGRLLGKIGMRLSFVTDPTDRLMMVTFQRVDLLETDLADKMPLHNRIAYTLKRGPMTVDQLAGELQANRDSVSRALRRGLDRIFVKLGDERYALLARDQ
ncbi:MAG TPA: AAA family ATPase [Patescibacteria group bacterium]|nr:AAA family ATPase [Patescibacteria group bacterium]